MRPNELLTDTYEFDDNLGKDQNDVNNVLDSYKKFIYAISDVLDRSNSRQTPREANLFTTNYDLFVEKAVDIVLKEQTPLVFNDGARGYFNRYLDSSNFNRMVAYKGLNNNYIDELPSLTLIKPHGSVNWEKSNDGQVIIRNKVVGNPVVVPPTGREGEETFLNNHFHDMLRVFQLELDKPESVLFVLGFSFQDDHIARMIRRALENRRLIIECFCWSDEDKDKYLSNLKYTEQPNNLKFIMPKELGKEHLYLSDLGDILLGDFE
ncbi:SIR2 family protein [Limosilactobacillus fermentum]|nr:SIR2 family protein [Limosilactobacillus fermentum]